MTDREMIVTMSEIANRGLALFDKHGISEDKMTLMMDIEFVHKVNPLRLDEMLIAPEADFAHDMFGIREHFNRETKQLENCFAPRYSL